MVVRVCTLHGIHDIKLEAIPTKKVGPDEVRIEILAGGICGSDLHYFHDGGIGSVRVREPIIVGHEASGRVIETGVGVQSLSRGDIVAINPSQPCGVCEYCADEDFVHCENMRFMGSAYNFPHEQGLFREQVVVPSSQVFKFNNPEITPQEAACAEPLAVCLHARNQAPSLSGKCVLVTGSGPIGALCVALAKNAGAKSIVVTDLHDFALTASKAIGADQVINLTKNYSQFEEFKAGKGHFDVVFECSAASAAYRDALQALRPKGTMVLVGVTGDTTLPINLIVSKEISVKGTHRFHQEFANAVEAIDTKSIDVSPIIGNSYDIENTLDAFEIAGDRSKSLKVHVLFNQA